MKELLSSLSAFSPALRRARSAATKYVWPNHTRFFKRSLDPFLRCSLILSVCLTLLPQASVARSAALVSDVGVSTKPDIGVPSVIPRLDNMPHLKLKLAAMFEPSAGSPAKPQVIPALQGTEVCGTIDTSTSWTLVNSPYVVTCNVTVAEGVTLSVEPGVVVKFDSGTKLRIYQNASLTAIGTADNPIYFTSVKDDTVGGDTNGDSGATLPAKGDWHSIYVEPSDYDSPYYGSLTFDHVVVRYGNYAIPDGFIDIGGAASIQNSTVEEGDYAGIKVHRGPNSDPAVTIQNSIVRNHHYGIYIKDTSPDINNNMISNNEYGMYASSSSASIVNNTISVKFAGIGISLYDASAIISDNVISYNNPPYYGRAGIYCSRSAPTLTNNVISGFDFPVSIGNGYPQQVPSYSGNTFTDNHYDAIGVSGDILSGTWANMAGYLHVIAGYAKIVTGADFTFPTGSVVKFAPYSVSQGEIHVNQNASLTAIGTADNPIYFTSVKDDTVGGDTNGDSGATLPAKGDWRSIYVEPSDYDSPYYGSLTFDHVVVRYGNYAIPDGFIDIGGAASIQNSTVEEGDYAGIKVHRGPNSDPAVTIQNSIVRNHHYGIKIHDASLTVNHNNIYANSSYGVYNGTSSILIDAENNWWGDASGPYHPTTNPDGQGDRVSDYVDYDPWLTGIYVPPPSAYETSHNSSPSSTTDAKVADPVSVIFGNYTYQHTDLSIPGSGLPTTIQRTYNSITSSITTEGPFGYGWTYTYAISATQETTSTVMIKNKDGRLDRFTEDGEGGYTPPPGTFNTLTKNLDDTFTLSHKDQTAYHFDASDRLASIVDKNGNTVTLAYTGDSLTAITDAAGRTTTLTYDANNHITQITDPAGRSVTYDYDVDGSLTSVTDARGNTTTYAYDSEHRLTSITDANGHTFVQNTYDSQGRVIEQQDALSNLTTFSYDPAARQTTVTDPLGSQTVYTYDADWRATGETDALGYTESYTYDDYNNRTSVTDKNGNTTYYAYDTNGNTTVITDTMGYTTTMTYDAQNNLTGRTDALGGTTTFAYDASGNLTGTTNASGTTSFAYDGLGQMISTTDANGNTTQFGCDAYGYQTAITDTLGNVTTFTYDNVGRKLSETDAKGNTTAYAYDAHNNLLTITDALLGVTSYTYDDVGNRISVTDSLSHTTTYTHDEKDRLVSITDAMTNTTTYGYDANDNRTQETNVLSHTTVYTYNAVNLLVQVEDPLSNVTTYAYDGNGNRTSVTDANGNATTFTYDALNRLTQVVDPLGNTTTYAYDVVGNKTSVTDANGNTTSYEYDALNRLIQVTDALGGAVTYDYDPVGNKTAMTDANGHVTQYEYDPLNRLLRVTDPLSHTTNYNYDAVGNKTSLLDANGDTTIYTYDALNRLTQITYPDNTVQYAYNSVGNRTAMTDTTGATTYVYDALDRLTSVTSPGSSHTVSYSYDAVGNRTGITYPDSQQVTYTYDAANRLITVTDWAARVTSYTYDSVGSLTTISYPNGTEASYSYDDANRLLQLTNTGPGGTISSFSYTLDDVGNRTQVVEAAGDVITYTYDALYRLTDVWEQMRVDFDSNCHVDVADIQQVASRWRMKDTDPGWDAWYDLDGDGDTDVVDIMLTVVHWGEICESASYTYDTMGNRLSMTTPTETITYTYDAADRLLNISDGTTFTWDANGNQLSKGDTNYTYDTANRLIQVANGATIAQFTYDGDGKRTSKTVNGTSTSYLYDVNTILPVVLVETTDGADTLYTYGADLIAMTEPGGIQSYYHYDGLGSVRNLSDGTGTVIASYTYDAFGKLRLMKGSSDNAFKFTGEQTDDETGLIYLRARYYDPSVGRFVAKDPFSGIENSIQTLNRYVYVLNNPINDVDPSGEVAPLAILGIVGGYVVGAAATGAIQSVVKWFVVRDVLMSIERTGSIQLSGRETYLREAKKGIKQGILFKKIEHLPIVGLPIKAGKMFLFGPFVREAGDMPIRRTSGFGQLLEQIEQERAERERLQQAKPSVTFEDILRRSPPGSAQPIDSPGSGK